MGVGVNPICWQPCPCPPHPRKKGRPYKGHLSRLCSPHLCHYPAVCHSPTKLPLCQGKKKARVMQACLAPRACLCVNGSLCAAQERPTLSTGQKQASTGAMAHTPPLDLSLLPLSLPLSLSFSQFSHFLVALKGASLTDYAQQEGKTKQKNASAHM